MVKFKSARTGSPKQPTAKHRWISPLGTFKFRKNYWFAAEKHVFPPSKQLAADPTLKVGTQANTTNYLVAQKYLPETRIQAYDQMPFAVQALLSGDVDAVVIDTVAGMGYQGQNTDQLQLLDQTLSS